MKHLLFTLLLAGTSLMAWADGDDSRAESPFYPVWTPRECLFWRDSLVVPEGKGRTQWARRCAPEYEGYYRYGDKQGTPDGMRSPLYPVFGALNEKGEPVNPRRYFAPVVAPTHDEDCDLPPDYTLVGLCPGMPLKARFPQE